MSDEDVPSTSGERAGEKEQVRGSESAREKREKFSCGGFGRTWRDGETFNSTPPLRLCVNFWF